jgi:HK97 family phage major capsid protein/HK97 family phage prohead protease
MKHSLVKNNRITNNRITNNRMKWLTGLWQRSHSQAKKLNPKKSVQTPQRSGFAHALIERSMINEDTRSIDIAFSSEAPIERYFGYEVLDHSPGSMRTERLEGGAALLLNHDWDDQIGVVESISLGVDGKARAKVRFGSSTRAQEIYQDVLDGIRKHISVGYQIHDLQEQGQRDGKPFMRVTDWEPYEISIVSVPADPSVGVGRNLADNAPLLEIPPEEKPSAELDTSDHLIIDQSQDSQPMEKILRNKKGDLVRALVDESGNITKVLEVIEQAGAHDTQIRQQERDRINAIRKLGEDYQEQALAERFLAEVDNGTLDEFENWIRRNSPNPQKQQRDKNLTRALTATTPATTDLGLNAGEMQRFSFIKAIRALANPNDKRAQDAAGFEREVSIAAQQRLGREAQGFLIPDEILNRTLNTATSGTNIGDTGGYTIATDLLAGSFIDILRNNTLMMQLGQVMGGLVGNIEIPKQISSANGYWIGEDDDAPETDIDFGQIKMTPHTVAACSEITRALMQQSSLDTEALVRKDLARALALTIDKASLYGTGSDNQPKGITQTDGINVYDLATANKPSYAEVVGMESTIAADNADTNAMRYLMHTQMRGHFKTEQKFKGTNGNPVWEPGNTLNGYNTGVTNQMNPGDLLFGHFSDLIIGLWGGLDLTVDPYSNSKKGRLRVVVFQDVDFVVRRSESFCLARKVA